LPLTRRCYSSSRRSTARPDPSDFISELAFADDLLLLSDDADHLCENFHALQRLAERCGLFLNFAKGKTEHYTTCDRFDRTLQDCHGTNIITTDHYKYLGSHPTHAEASFYERKGMTWQRIHQFDDLWKCDRVAWSTKSALFDSVVASMFVCMAWTWPRTVAWQDRIDGSYSSMIQHCLGGDRRVDTYLNGRRPLMSASALTALLTFVGHGFRHDSVLPNILFASEGPFARRPHATHRTIDADLARWIPLDVEEWGDLFQNRHEWRTFINKIARSHENQSWNRYYKKCHARWAARAGTISATYHLHYNRDWPTAESRTAALESRFLSDPFVHEMPRLQSAWTQKPPDVQSRETALSGTARTRTRLCPDSLSRSIYSGGQQVVSLRD